MGKDLVWGLERVHLMLEAELEQGTRSLLRLLAFLWSAQRVPDEMGCQRNVQCVRGKQAAGATQQVWKEER